MLHPNALSKLYKMAENTGEKLFPESTDEIVPKAQNRELENFGSAPASVHKAPGLLL